MTEDCQKGIAKFLEKKVVILTGIRVLRITVWTSLLVLSSSIVSYACNPALATVCQRFERAEAVFVGTLTKAELRDEGSFTPVYATFSVREVYKGTVGSVETVKFGTGDCDPKVDQIGKIYFVYKEPYSRIVFVANYTHVLTKGDSDLEFAKRVNTKRPVFRISAFLVGLEKADRRKTQIFITNGRTRKRVPIDGDGWFEYITSRPGNYNVTILLPKTASIGWEQLKAFSDIVDGKSFTYEVNYSANGCDVRQINISPK